MLENINNKDDFPTRDEWLTNEINSRIKGVRDTSMISDGSHTFGELYHHRAVLSSVVFNKFKECSWKSREHSNGDMIKNYFIVGIDTPEGQFTYHYPLDYWNYFKVKVLDLAPEWDGHSSDDVERLISLIDLG